MKVALVSWHCSDCGAQLQEVIDASDPFSPPTPMRRCPWTKAGDRESRLAIERRAGVTTWGCGRPYRRRN